MRQIHAGLVRRFGLLVNARFRGTLVSGVEPLLTRRWSAGVAAAAFGVLGFISFAVTLLVDVSSARTALAHDVRWLISVQALSAALNKGPPAPELLETVTRFSETGVASPATTTALVDVQRTLAINDPPAARDALNALTLALRSQTSAISTQLDDAWSRLVWLVLGSLALAL